MLIKLIIIVNGMLMLAEALVAMLEVLLPLDNQ